MINATERGSVPDHGTAETAIRRLNIAQTLNPLGLLIGMYLGSRLISPTVGHFAQLLSQPFVLVGVGLMLFAYLVDNVQFSPEATKRVAKNDRTMDDLKRVFAHRSFRFGLGALALYIVGHTVLWGFSVRYSQSVMPVASGMVPANSDCGRFTHSSSAGSSELV